MKVFLLLVVLIVASVSFTSAFGQSWVWDGTRWVCKRGIFGLFSRCNCPASCLKWQCPSPSTTDVTPQCTGTAPNPSPLANPPVALCTDATSAATLCVDSSCTQCPTQGNTAGAGTPLPNCPAAGPAPDGPFLCTGPPLQSGTISLFNYMSSKLG